MEYWFAKKNYYILITNNVYFGVLNKTYNFYKIKYCETSYLQRAGKDF